MRMRHVLVLLTLAAALAAPAPAAEKRKLLLIAGGASHGYAEHEHKAGCLLLAKWINEAAPGVEATVSQGWPDNPAQLAAADAIAVYCDGGPGGMVMQHHAEVAPLMKKGVGLALLHYALDLPAGEAGDRMTDWLGGHYEPNWSVNPVWLARFEALPQHPAARGVRPFTLRDEWYYHMRFRGDMQGVTPLLTAVPPAETRNRPDGPHSGNPVVRSRTGMAEHVAWAYDRPGGGRGFGFTGGHYHLNWTHDDFRTLVLNALTWISGAEVPAGGVKVAAPSAEELLKDIPKPRPGEWTAEFAQKRIHSLRASGDWK